MTAVQPAPPASAPAPAPAPAIPVPRPRAAKRPRRSGLRRPPAAPPSRMSRLLPRTVASRIRVLTAAVLVALLALLAVIAIAVGNAKDGVRVIGKDAGPQVVATGNLYFHLTNMDAQLANALLIGRTQNLGMRRDDALRGFDESRLAAGDALLKAAKLADERTEDETARESLNALARYERLAGQALLLDERSAHAAGPPSQDVIAYYRQATDLMKLDLLPKAYNLTLDNGTLVRHTYEDERRAVMTGQVLVYVIGAVALGLLVALQFFLFARFRRLLNPALAVASLIVLALMGSSAVMLSGQMDDLRTAKTDGFDSLLALSRARAISTSANADETRYLLDPGRADTYEQVYLSKSQSVLYRPADNLDLYNEAVQRDLGNPQVDVLDQKYLGFLGREADYGSLPGQPKAYRMALQRYSAFQQSDSRVRALVRAGQRDRAIAARLGGGTSGFSSDRDFTAYDASMQQLFAIHRKAFDQAVADGDKGIRGWNAGVPLAGLLIIGLVLVGIRPRLAEYR
ncbi:hypothetical protein [Actinomadura sp. 9N407]|uniref:hypothetical protein n=1 Tax=Actinomadura sp. 9N407 TaxID=3375154 RepID=UPI0037A14F16